jgi:hypothetical protein
MSLDEKEHASENAEDQEEEEPERRAFFCFVCSKEMNSQASYRDHIKGKKHGWMVQFQEDRLPGNLEYCGVCNSVTENSIQHATKHRKEMAVYDAEVQRCNEFFEWGARPSYCADEDCAEIGRWFCAGCGKLYCFPCIGTQHSACAVQQPFNSTHCYFEWVQRGTEAEVSMSSAAKEEGPPPANAGEELTAVFECDELATACAPHPASPPPANAGEESTAVFECEERD